MAITTLITQDEIISTLTIDDHFSVNNITDSAIKKAELYLANTFLGSAFYSELLADKTATAIFDNSDFQYFYENYLLRLISEYVMMSSVIEIVLKLANNGTENSEKINSLKYYKDTLKDEVNTSKDMISLYLTSTENALKFPNFLENAATVTDVVKPKSYAGFLIETNLKMN